MGISNLNCMFLHPVTEREMLKMVNCCKLKYSCDFNDLSMHIVKSTFKAVLVPFTYICNLSFASGVFLDMMKIAKVIPLFKAAVTQVSISTGPFSFFHNFRKF